MKKSKEQQNAELMLSKTHEDVQEATRQLTGVHADIKDARAELQSVIDEAEQHRQKMADERNELHERGLALELKEAEHANKRKEYDDLDRNIAKAKKDLARLNDAIFVADQEYDQKQGDLRDINAKIAEKGRLAEGILALQDEYATQEKRRDSIRLENNLSLDNARAELREIEVKKDRAIKTRDAAIEAAALAETERQNSVSERRRIDSDLQIYISRVTAKYEEAFPGLTVKL